jgi:hypothetical protein
MGIFMISKHIGTLTCNLHEPSGTDDRPQYEEILHIAFSDPSHPDGISTELALRSRTIPRHILMSDSGLSQHLMRIIRNELGALYLYHDEPESVVDPRSLTDGELGSLWLSTVLEHDKVYGDACVPYEPSLKEYFNSLDEKITTDNSRTISVKVPTTEGYAEAQNVGELHALLLSKVPLWAEVLEQFNIDFNHFIESNRA